MARLCGIISVILLFSSGVLIAAALYTFIGAKNATGYSFTLMAIAQFLSFLAALLVAHWMVNKQGNLFIKSIFFFLFIGSFVYCHQLNEINKTIKKKRHFTSICMIHKLNLW